MLTTLDKLWCLIFTLTVILGGLAGTVVVLVYLIDPNDLPQPGQNFSVGQVLLVLGGLALGYAVALSIFAFISRRFVSASTHERWAEYMEASSFAKRRYPGPYRLVRWVLLPDAYRRPRGGHAL